MRFHLLTFLAFNFLAMTVRSQSIMEIGKIATPWELEKKEANIEAYTRKVEGKVLKEFKIVCQMPLPLDSVKAIINNLATWSQWYSKAFYGWQILDTLPDGYLMYCSGHTPTLVAERDFVLQTTASMAGEKYLMKIKARPEAYPLQRNRLRVDEMEMLWVLSPLSPTLTETVFMGFSSPGGSLPEGFANTIMIQMPMETVGNLCKYLQKQQNR